jgi:hypothetical protein
VAVKPEFETEARTSTEVLVVGTGRFKWQMEAFLRRFSWRVAVGIGGVMQNA